MTFEEFQGSARSVEDLSDLPHAAAQEMSGPGRAYVGDSLFIQRVHNGWMLTLSDSSAISTDLKTQEVSLYLWALFEDCL